MSVSWYDQVSGMLLAVLVILGFVTALMFLVWLSTRLMWRRPVAVVQVLEDVGGGGSGDNLAASEQGFEEPLVEELPPTEPPVETTLESISAVVQQTPALDVPEARSFGKGQGDGLGDGRGKGPGGPGTSDGVPAWERWEVRLTVTTLDVYAKQLDYFQVELGVAGGGDPNVTYLSKLSNPKATIRKGSPKDEKRLRFLHRSGQLREADRMLVSRAGVDPTGRVVFQFYPEQTYQALLAQENAKMGSRRIAEIKKTVFGVREAAGGFEFFVISQEYRDGTSA